MSSNFLTYSPAVIGFVGLMFAMMFYIKVKALPSGNETMNRIAGYIRQGSMAFLSRQYKVLSVYTLVVFLFISLSMGV